MIRDRLRVGHVTLGLATGGQERLLLDFVRHADRERFDSIVVSLTTRGRLADELESLGARVIAVDAPPRFHPRLVSRLKRLFLDERIDVVHTHDERPLVYGVPAARWAGCRVIHTQHHGQLPGASWKQETMVHWVGRLPHEFVAVSHDAARYYARVRRPISVIWNGVDSRRFGYQGPLVGGPAVTVARLSPEKNIGCLLRAVAIVHAADPEFRLEIAGDGPCREELERDVEKCRLKGVVSFLGNVQDVPSVLARAGLFVLPSRSEGVSLTLLEAMARGLPVVATRVGGNPEVVLDGQTGILVPSDDATALAEALRSIRVHPADAQLMGRAGRRRVEDHFEIRGMVAAYERLYDVCRAETSLAEQRKQE